MVNYLHQSVDYMNAYTVKALRQLLGGWGECQAVLRRIYRLVFSVMIY